MPARLHLTIYKSQMYLYVRKVGNSPKLRLKVSSALSSSSVYVISEAEISTGPVASLQTAALPAGKVGFPGANSPR
jgi:hypothetical protein